MHSSMGHPVTCVGCAVRAVAQMILTAAKRIAQRAWGVAAQSCEWHQRSSPAVGRFSHAFAFDIDGVLCKGKHAIPQAKEAMIKV